MSSIEHRQTSEIETQPLHRIARVPVHVPPRRAHRFLSLVVAIDVALIALYLASTLPEIRALTPAGRLASLDLAISANLPWTWGVLKFYLISLTCGLMAFSYSGGQRPDGFWRFGAAVALIMALAESARLHEIWAAGLAPLLFGADTDAQISMLVSRGGLAALFYVATLSLFPTRSKPAFVLLLASIGALTLAEVGPPMALISDWIAPITPESVIVAWNSGLRRLSQSLILGGLWYGIRDIQAVSVRYVYRG